jgi:hypothetical protein
MTADTILAIDLGKYKCVACAYDRATTAAEYRTVTTSRAEVERLIRASGVLTPGSPVKADTVSRLAGCGRIVGWGVRHVQRGGVTHDPSRAAAGAHPDGDGARQDAGGHPRGGREGAADRRDRVRPLGVRAASVHPASREPDEFDPTAQTQAIAEAPHDQKDPSAGGDGVLRDGDGVLRHQRAATAPPTTRAGQVRRLSSTWPVGASTSSSGRRRVVTTSRLVEARPGLRTQRQRNRG